MSLYESLRHFADSWGLLALTLVFLAALLWVFRPGASATYARQAKIPFRYDDSAELRRDGGRDNG